MRASLDNVGIFTFYNCYFFNFQMYQQIYKCTDKTPKRHYWGGGGGPLATLMIFDEGIVWTCLRINILGHPA